MANSAPAPPVPTRDLFIAHADADADLAKRLYEALPHGCAAFLDTEHLGPGQWSKQLVEAQNDALITVVLVSTSTPAAFYAQEEIDRGIALHRHTGVAHQVVPVLVDDAAWDVRELPYGTVSLQRIHAASDDLTAVASQLAKWAADMRFELQLAASAPPSEAEPTAGFRRLPPIGRCLGREQVVARVSARLAAGRAAVLLLGGPGIGKSTVLRAAMHHETVATGYGDRRVVATCAAAPTPQAVLLALAEQMGIAAGPALEDRVAEELQAAPVVVGLDNAEAPWNEDQLGTESLFGRLADIETVSLAVAMRRGTPPGGPAWSTIERIHPLEPADAATLFRAVAGESTAAEEILDNLLRAMDYVPLAVELLAHAALAEPHLPSLAARWERERTELLQRGGGDDPLLSVGASVEVSLASPLITEEALRLLGILALLPEGIAHADLDDLLPDAGLRGAARLRQLALGYDVPGRLRALQPIREHVRTTLTLSQPDLDRVAEHYLALGERASEIGSAEGAAIAALLLSENANVEAAIQRVLPHRLDSAVAAATGLAKFSAFTGIQLGPGLIRVAEAARNAGDHLAEAHCTMRLGDLELVAYNYEAAQGYFERASVLYQRSSGLSGEADCGLRLGDLMLRRSELTAAHPHFQRSLDLYAQTGDPRGQAACLVGLAKIDHRNSRSASAQDRYETAYALYMGIDDILGQAQCITGRAEIAHSRGSYVPAAELFRAASPLYGRAGDPRGVARCLIGLAEISGIRGDYDDAVARYEEAADLYRRVGDTRGQAICIFGRASIAAQRDERTTASDLYGTALELFSALGDDEAVENCRLGLAIASRGGRDGPMDAGTS